MRIFAVRDRMIGYFLTPFFAPSDKEVMAGISQEINRPDNQNAIAQAPHHFEIHQLGEIDDNGNLTAHKEFVCDCGTLVRARRSTTQPDAAETARFAAENVAATFRAGSNRSANGQLVPQSSEIEHPTVAS